MVETVTIGKSYFEALLRRAELVSLNYESTSGPEYEHLGGPNVSISWTEYASLLQASQEYGTLRNALIQGGCSPQNLDILTGRGEQQDQRKDSGYMPNAWDMDAQDVGIFYYKQSQMPTEDATLPSSGGMQRSGLGMATKHFSVTSDKERTSSFEAGVQTNHLNRHISHNSRISSHGNPDSPSEYGDVLDRDFDDLDDVETAQPTRDAQRSIYFKGLSDRVTYKDLTDVIRGGKILDIHINKKDRTARVAMLDGAAEFLAHVKRDDLYVKTKRVKVTWNDRQYGMNANIADKVRKGATRNIVIRNGGNRFTEAEIRDDMEHIHNLVIIHMVKHNNDVFIETNSVHHALFAKTCMLSRQKYKGLKIEWFEDACAGPLPSVHRPRVSRVAQTAVYDKKRPTNIYEALFNLEGTEASDGENLSPAYGDEYDDDTLDESCFSDGVALDD